MDSLVFVLILAAALMHAWWNTLLKMAPGGDRLLTLALVVAVGLPCALPLLLWADAPAPASWPYLALSSAIHVGYVLFLVRAYDAGDLSCTYPLARGAAPPLVAAGGYFLLGESLTAGQVAAVALVSAGIAAIVFSQPKIREGGWRPIAWSLATAGFIASYSLVDGVGVRASGSALGYVAWLNAGFAVVVGAPICFLRRRTLRAFVRERWRGCVGGGVLAFAAYGLVLWAFSLGALAPVVALRETSVVFAALIGARLLREPLGGLRVAPATTVAAGAVLLQLAA